MYGRPVAATAGPAPAGAGASGAAKSSWRRPHLFGIPRFDELCLAPRDPVTVVRSQPTLGLCGRPLCGGADQEVEVTVVRGLRCGHCTAVEPEGDLLVGVPEPLSGHSKLCAQNMSLARTVVREIFTELQCHCDEERRHYMESGLPAPRHKANVWETYTNRARLQAFAQEAMEFVRQCPECRMRPLTAQQLRFLITLQHHVQEDTSDFYKPEPLRKHQDSFEGVLTDGVNSQLVKDAHRSEFSVDGQSFTMQDLPSPAEAGSEERREMIAKFQSEFVTALETYLLAFCGRKGLSPLGTRRLVQAVTTQMSQAGLANLDRGSQASRYFVGSHGLDQRTAYNLSTMQSRELGECLKLSVLCMKTGFSQYLERDNLLRTQGVEYPKRCSPASYLYQYATLRFTTGVASDTSERTICTVLDALDEAHLQPVSA